MSEQKKWKEKTKEEKKSFIIKLIVLLVFVVGVILTFAFTDEIFGENSVFNKTICDNSFINTLYQKISALIRSIQIVVIAYLLNILIKFVMHKSFARSKRGKTIVKLLDSFIKYVIAIAAILMILNAWGVDTATLVASVGVLSLIIGLGAQSLVADIIAGMFIVFEGTYEVGDIIVIDGWRGTVQEIGIRTTKLIDAAGNIKVVNNSSIDTVINQTQELSWTSVCMSLYYEADLLAAEKIIKEHISELKEMIPTIVEGPYYKGVAELSDYSIEIKFVAKCKEEDFYQTQRELYRALILFFDKYGIDMPYPQIVVNPPEDFQLSSSNSGADKKIQKDIQDFVNEQSRLSKGSDDVNNTH